MGCNLIQKANLNAVRILLLSDTDAATFLKDKLRRVIKSKNFDVLLSNPLNSTSYTNYAMHRIIWYLDVWCTGLKVSPHWRYYLTSEDTLNDLVKAFKHEPYTHLTVDDERASCDYINRLYKRVAAEYQMNID